MTHGYARRTVRALLLLAAVLFADIPALDAQTVSPTPEWRFLWDEGFRLTAPDNVTTFKLGGLFQYDLARDVDGGPRLSDSHDWRMIRPNLSGRITKDIDWRAEFDFANPQVRMTDVYVRMSNLPWVKSVRVGHMKEPFSIDQFTSSANVTFPEVALPNALAPARGYGVMVGGPFCEDRMTGYAGVFRNTAHAPSRSTSGGEAWAVTGRVTALPLYEDGGRRLVHLGAAASLRWPSEPVRFSARPESALADALTSAGAVDADDVQLFGGEAAIIRGPFFVTGEFIAARADRSVGGDLWLEGFYVEAGWFITGESRPYDRKTGTFGQVKPTRSVLDGGPGAWQLAARYSMVDLTGSGLPATARKLRDVTVGVNWYLTKNLKLSVDYVHSDADPSARDGGLFAARLQASF